MKLVYTVEAIEDLKRLREFIAVHNPMAVKSIARELIARIELLSDFPQMGIPVQMSPEPDEIRDIVFGKYLVRYSLHTKTIIILRVWHGLENER